MKHGLPNQGDLFSPEISGSFTKFRQTQGNVRETFCVSPINCVINAEKK